MELNWVIPGITVIQGKQDRPVVNWIFSY